MDLSFAYIRGGSVGSGSASYDTVEETKQLEYYGQNAVTPSSNYSFAIKKKTGTAQW